MTSNVFIDESDLAHIWQKTSACITELDSARLFITGGTGFFGCWLLESLRYAKKHLGLNTQLTVLTRNPSAFIKKMPHLAKMPGLQLLAGDVTSFVYPPGQFTHVIHAATEASVQLLNEQPLLMLDTIVQGTRHTLNFATQANVQKFLFTSSGAVYGTQPPTVSHMDETYIGGSDSLDMKSTYGLGKCLSEHLCELYSKQHDIDVKIARCFAFVGPYLPLTSHFAIGNFIFNVKNNEPIHIQGDGTSWRSYLYAADLVIWLWTILCKGTSGRAYNVGSEDAINISDLANLVIHTAQTNLSVVVSKQPDLYQPAARYVPNTQRAQNELHLKQWISMQNGIQKTFKALSPKA